MRFRLWNNHHQSINTGFTHHQKTNSQFQKFAYETQSPIRSNQPSNFSIFKSLNYSIIIKSSIIMFKIITAATAALIGLLATAQVSETRNVSQFNKVEITDGVEIIYTRSNQISIKAEASDALGLATLLTESKDNTLRISCNGNLCELAKVYVSAPELVSVKASRNAYVRVTNGIETQNFDLIMASGATFKGNVNSQNTALKAKSGAIVNLRLETGSLTARIQSNAKVNLCGRANSSEIRSFGSTLCLARNFKSGIGMVKASGTASVEISALDEIDVEVTDNATVRYFGFPPKTTVNAGAMAQVVHDTAGAVAKQ
jgi:hypothetical protein